MASYLDEMPLSDKEQVRMGWHLLGHRIVRDMLRPDCVTEGEIDAEIRRAKDRVQAAAVEFGMGLFPEPGTIRELRQVTAMIRSAHPYSYRSGEWAVITGITYPPGTGRACYAVQFPDGAENIWIMDDSAEPEGYRHGYEFLMTGGA